MQIGRRGEKARKIVLTEAARFEGPFTRMDVYDAARSRDQWLSYAQLEIVFRQLCAEGSIHLTNPGRKPHVFVWVDP